MPATFPKLHDPACRPRLMVRADEGPKIGAGHSVRCLALTQHWTAAGGDAMLVVARGGSPRTAGWRAEQIPVMHIGADAGSAADAELTAELADKFRATWIAADAYHFDGWYQAALKSTGRGVLVMDDFGHATHYHADLIVNQNVDAAASLYAGRENGAGLLLGTRYVLLRSSFLRYWRVERPVSAVARKVLVTLGGGDSPGIVRRVLETLAETDRDLEVELVLGGACLHADTLRDNARRMPYSCTVRQSVLDMSGLMHWADVAISAGGSTCWELAFMGVPTLAIAIAEHQRAIGSGLERAGFAHYAWHEDFTVAAFACMLREWFADSRARRKMARSGKRMVDGLGGWRVISRMNAFGLHPALVRGLQDEDRISRQ